MLASYQQTIPFVTGALALAVEPAPENTAAPTAKTRAECFRVDLNALLRFGMFKGWCFVVLSFFLG